MPLATRSRTFSIAGAAVFLSSALLIFLLIADLFHPSLDEGIYLEGGHRVLLGQAPYRDFFAYTGPLIYWTQAFLERIFGQDLRMLRLSTVIACGLTCFAIFWMAERFVGWKIAATTAFVFLGMRMPSFQHFTISHRWLSTSLLTVSMAFALDAERYSASGDSRARWHWFAAGGLAAAAAWSTPPYLIPLAVLLIWNLYRRSLIHTAFVAGGVLLVSLPAILWLTLHGAFVPMLDKLVWVSRQYSVANRVPYGYYPFGFQATAAAAGIHKGLAWIRDARMMIPVVLIPLTLAIGAVRIARRRSTGPAALLVWLALAMLLTTWPRWDVNLLIGVTPPCYVLLAIWCEEFLTSASGAIARAAVLGVYAGALTLACFYALTLWLTVDSFSYFPTRVGLLRNIEGDADAYAMLEQTVPEGESLFVFPYMPVMGYMLKGRNPTSYSYLQPGMMSRADEATALRELEAKPPRFILRQYFPDEQILSVWPNSDRSEMRFQSIEDFIAQRYVPRDRVSSPHFAMTVFERRGSSIR